jgi:cytochrome c biogenesis protein CcmG/thiol:disulfide interchange protein DsbE
MYRGFVKSPVPKYWFIIPALCLGIGALWVLFASLWIRHGPELDIRVPQVGFKSPDFTLPAITGQMATLSDYQGQPVILNFWASWCTPCKSEMGTFNNIYKTYHSQGIIILAVNLTNQDDIKSVLDLVETNGLTYPILLDESGDVSRIYKIRSLPTTLFIQPDGVILEKAIGGPLQESYLVAQITKLLGLVP